MIYSDIKSKVYLLTKTNSTSFPDATLVIEANNALERVASLIMQTDGRWQWDDSNQTDLPVATTDLVNNQQDYSLAVTYLNVSRVQVKNNDGIARELQPIDQSDLRGYALDEFLKTAGMPRFYDKIGSSVFLYPKPSTSYVTASAGLKIWFQRPPSYFVAGDTTKQPGFNALYHDLIPLWVAYNYALANSLPNTNQLMIEIQRKEDALMSDYAAKSRDESLQLRTRFRTAR